MSIDKSGWDEPRVTWTVGRVSAGNLEAGVELRSEFDLVINVNDAYTTESSHFWFPINEVAPWGYAPFFFVKRIIDAHPDANVLIHCAAGACRSPLMVFGYTMSHGMPPEEVEAKYGGRYMTLYARMKRDGIIPANLPEFYDMMNKWPENSLMGVLARIGDPRKNS